MDALNYDKLLFTRNDLADPGQSALLREIHGLGEHNVSYSADCLIAAFQGPMDDVHALQDIAARLATAPAVAYASQALSPQSVAGARRPLENPPWRRPLSRPWHRNKPAALPLARHRPCKRSKHPSCLRRAVGLRQTVGRGLTGALCPTRPPPRRKRQDAMPSPTRGRRRRGQRQPVNLSR